MGQAEVHCVQGQADVQGMKDAADVLSAAVPGLERLAELLHCVAQILRAGRVLRVRRGYLDESLVLELYLAESQLVIGSFAGQELNDVLFEGDLEAEKGEKHETAPKQHVHKHFMAFEPLVKR